MKYITDLFDTLWDDKLEDRTDKVKAEHQRLAKTRKGQKKADSLTTDKNKNAPATTKI